MVGAIGIGAQAEGRAVGLMAVEPGPQAAPLLPMERLSGGNQQKAVLARWPERKPEVLILDNPMRGVDAGARQEICRVLRDLTDRGVAIVLITDGLLELIGLSNRILILQHGGIVAEVPAPPEAKPAEQTLVAQMLSARAPNQTAKLEAAE